MNKKGFTLIELLAVIVILAIIALIATPIILNVIDNAKKGAAKSSVLGYIDAVEKSVAIGKVDTTKGISIPSDNELSIENDEDFQILGKVSIKGTYPDFVAIQFEKGKIKTAQFCMNGYSFDYNSKELNSSNGDDNHCSGTGVKNVTIKNSNTKIFVGDTLQLDLEVDSKDEDYKVKYSSSDEAIATVSDTGKVIAKAVGEVTIFVKAGYKTTSIKITISTGITYVAPTASDTHKGIVYLDPTNLENKCNASNSAFTETYKKSGCMTWYVYDVTENTYKLILDHNTDGRVNWISYDDFVAAGGAPSAYGEYGNSTKGPITAKNQVISDASGWVPIIKSTARLITADEVAKIFGRTSLDKNFYQPIYFDSNSYTATATATNKSKYAWLYDHLNSCGSHGCNYEDTFKGGYGYWTDTAITNYSHVVWLVWRDGYIGAGCIKANDTGGVRPVIEIPKSMVS